MDLPPHVMRWVEPPIPKLLEVDDGGSVTGKSGRCGFHPRVSGRPLGWPQTTGGPESNGFDIFTIKLTINWEQIRHFYINAYETGGGDG